MHPRLMRSFLTGEGGAGLNPGGQTKWQVCGEQGVLVEGWFGNPIESVNALHFPSPQEKVALTIKKSGKHLTNGYRVRLFELSTGKELVDELIPVKSFSREKLTLPVFDFTGLTGLVELEISGAKSTSKGIKARLSRKVAKLLRSCLKRLSPQA